MKHVSITHLLNFAHVDWVEKTFQSDPCTPLNKIYSSIYKHNHNKNLLIITTRTQLDPRPKRDLDNGPISPQQ